MGLPYNLTNTNNPPIDATQLMANFNYLYALFTGSAGNNQNGTYSGVTADSTISGVTITFPTPFPNTIGPIIAIASNYSGTDNAGVYCEVIGNPTRFGFVVKPFNGSSGTTVTVNWAAWGT